MAEKTGVGAYAPHNRLLDIPHPLYVPCAFARRLVRFRRKRLCARQVAICNTFRARATKK